MQRPALHKVPLTICGEMASRPLEAMALIGLGCRSLSMAAAAIGPVKFMILQTNLDDLRIFMEEIMAQGGGDTRQKFHDWAEKNAIET